MAEKIAFASTARTADPTPAVINTNRVKEVQIVIDVTAIAATPSVVFNVDMIDNLSGKFPVLLASAAIVATGTTVLQLGKGLPVTANVSANCPIPENIRIRPVHGDADSITYSVSAHLIR